MANRPIVSWNESTPADADAFSEGDNRIREFKKQLREIFEEDHVIESSGSDSTWGYHKKATLIEQGSDEYVVGATSNKLNFDIGGGELTATIASTTYTDMGSTQADAGSLCKAIYDAIVAAEAVGTYTVTHDGERMTITRSAGTFSILWKTGTHGADGTSVSIGSIVSYSDLVDDTGALTYTADYVSGDPAAIADTFILYTRQVNSKTELFFKDEDSNTMQLTSAGVFIGGMINEIRMWSGTLANIPTGWTLCEGSGTTPNLVGKFIRGVNTSITEPTSDTTGGDDEMTMTVSIMKHHNHYLSGDGGHAHDIAIGSIVGGAYTRVTSGHPASAGVSTVYDWTDTSLHSHSDMQDTGSGTAWDNRPAYYELAYITRS